MLSIRKEQISAFEDQSLRSFEDEMVQHLKTFSPKQFEISGELGIRQIIILGIDRAKKYKFTCQGAVQFYIEMMLMFGNDFDTDPQYPLIRKLLNVESEMDQIERADLLHEKIMDYKEKVEGRSKKPSSIKSSNTTVKLIKQNCPEESDPIDDAIVIIENSDFAKTREGKKVLDKIMELHNNGNIEYTNLPDGNFGRWHNSKIQIPNGVCDLNFIASSVLVHEATHALYEDEFPKSKKKFTVDEELCCNTNELALYEEQRTNGYRYSNLERIRKKSQKNKIRNDVYQRYPGIPEHL